ncbi:MAG TPA: dipeptide epimerase [Gemmatales bacterium]|nr:dipeptide epimerase [Gemmatales bacterium]
MLKKLIARHIRLPLKKPVKHASHERHETANLVVEYHLDNGIVGYGEGVPRDYVTGETVESGLAVLRHSQLTGLKESPATFAEAVARIEQLPLKNPSIDDPRGIATNAVRCALELGYLDAYCQHFKEPLSAVTKLIAPEIYEPKDRIQYSIAITSATGGKLVGQALTYRLFGFHQCKVKVGIEGQDDVARLRNIRKWMGPGMHLRLDANEAWKVEEVAEHWKALSPFTIGWVEQPVLHEAIGELAKVRKNLEMKVMLDESLCGMQDAERCAGEGWGDLFNLRLSKCGGFIRTLKLASFAAKHGLGTQLGCQVGESAILSAAGRQFACSVKGLQALEGSFDRWLVKESLGNKDITFGMGGHAPALHGPGLGISINPQAVERVTQHQEVLLG